MFNLCNRITRVYIHGWRIRRSRLKAKLLFRYRRQDIFIWTEKKESGPGFCSCVIARADFPRWKKYGARAWTFVLVSPEHFFLWIERAREKPPVRLAFCPRVITRRTFMDGGEEVGGTRLDFCSCVAKTFFSK